MVGVANEAGWYGRVREGFLMKSMTGFGKGAVEVKGWRVEVEVQSVNQRRGFDLVVSVPRDHGYLERFLREVCAGVAGRGRLTVSVGVRPPPAPDGLGVNRARLRAVREAARDLAEELGVAEPASLEFFLGLPGVLEPVGGQAEPEVLGQAAIRAARAALKEWDGFRAREGKELARELARLLGAARRQVVRMAAAAGKAKVDLGASLRRRLREAGLELGRDDERVAKEIALLVERADITEELARLGSHLEEAGRLIGAGGEGRALEFLLQEAGREVNTIGSKTQSLAISRCVIALKGDLEKMREQIQNLE